MNTMNQFRKNQVESFFAAIEETSKEIEEMIKSEDMDEIDVKKLNALFSISISDIEAIIKVCGREYEEKRIANCITQLLFYHIKVIESKEINPLDLTHMNKVFLMNVDHDLEMNRNRFEVYYNFIKAHNRVLERLSNKCINLENRLKNLELRMNIVLDRGLY